MADTKTEAAKPTPEPGSNPTPGAIKAAEILTGGKFGSPKRYPTTYGAKTVQGVAAVIDRWTQPFDLARTAGHLADMAAKVHDPYGATNSASDYSFDEAIAAVRAALAAAQVTA